MNPRALVLLVLTLSLSGCLLLDNKTLVTKACTQIGYDSNFVFNIESTGADLPWVISGLVNNSLAFDECQTGYNSIFLVDHLDARHVTLTVFAPADSKLYDQFFDENGQPRSGAALEYYLYGRNYCGDDPLTFEHATVTPQWNPVQANGAGCGISGYTTNIQATQ